MTRSHVLFGRLLVLLLSGAISSVPAIAQSGRWSRASSSPPSSTSTAVSSSFTSLATTNDSYYDWVGIGLAGAVGAALVVLIVRHRERERNDARSLNRLDTRADTASPSRFLSTSPNSLFQGAVPEGAPRSSSALRARTLTAFGIRRHLTGFFRRLGRNTQLNLSSNKY
jgi:hypothetical protein